MKQTMQNATLRFVRRVFILNVLLLCCGMFYLIDNPVSAFSACFDAYEQCHIDCDDQYDPVNDPTGNANCHSNCLGPYGNCVNQAELDKEGEIISYYEEGQPMPILQDFQRGINDCQSCPLSLYLSDPAAYQTCVENKLACKTACIEQF